MNEDRGWIRIPKQSRRTRFEKYQNQLAVLISNTKSGARVYLTDKVMETLGHPTYVAVNRRKGSSTLALEPVQGEGDEGYRVITTKLKGFTVTPYITVNQIAKSYDLKTGAYEAFERNGMVVFDSADEPSAF